MISTLVMILNTIIYIYGFIIVAWAILSFFREAKLARDIRKLLDPLVAPYVNLFRKFIPPAGGMDFSPFVALMVLIVVRFLLGLLL